MSRRPSQQLPTAESAAGSRQSSFVSMVSGHRAPCIVLPLA
jgi:hypothetical protein